MESIRESLLLFQKGGPVMYLLLLCSLTVIGIAVERFLFYRAVADKPERFTRDFQRVLQTGEVSDALRLCRENGGFVARLAEKGLQCEQGKSRHLESVLEGEASLLANQLRKHLRLLDTIVTIAPLLGLLGTVIGMIGSFSVLNIKNGQPLAITGGVGEALVATATGLCVATVAMLAYSYFNHRLDGIVTAMEEICLLVLERNRDYEAS
ncbi:MotA/TolQ/ExbB proton channel family protein [Propionispora hippei]|uniref:Biopolymer transport protein ExbB n=1 Tax=Propionispora hippei DSM 15287 TaxID=1123003 RepID=A0A1M6KZF6_9FIRM|nr:MotA/TolQ/ExbB proton channel family protein [Propionispora hippei]SHJ64242.1 biopolymer transport protein ExbB [Propionispora hippei DSM 15287]